MAVTKKGGRLKWLIIILGVAALGIAAFFIIKAVTGGDGSSYKEYGVEQSAGGLAVKLNSVERQPMVSEKCQERMTVLTSSDDGYDCIIASVTVTNNSDATIDYSYRNFGYRDPRANGKTYSMAITLISFEGVDVTKELKPGASHTQEAHLVISKPVKTDELQLVYKVDPRAEGGGPEIVLDL
jgi:hypothetical protein